MGENGIRVELQPTFNNHATFTDFIIWITNIVGQVQFIEVKRTDINVDLTTETDSTAQALREAQILLCSNVQSPLPFVLTNGSIMVLWASSKTFPF